MLNGNYINLNMGKRHMHVETADCHLSSSGIESGSSCAKQVELTGAQILCETLIRKGVTVMFGIPGGTVMPFYNAMFQYRDRLRHVLCRHEQGAGHAAEGYARATGRIGVCIGTSGPGSTNLVTPIADAWMDSTPLLAITGQVMGPLIGTDAFQETDITGITLPITKHNYLVRQPEDIVAVISEAIDLALDGRTGPVHVDITKDAQQARCMPDWSKLESSQSLMARRKNSVDVGCNVSKLTQGFPKQVAEVIELLSSSKRPLLLVGNGVIQSGACKLLVEVAESLRVPVVTTLMGLGAIPVRHPLNLGMPGMHGEVHVNKAIQQCDTLVNIGSRFDDRVTGKASSFAPRARVVHIDIDRSELNKLIYSHVAIESDAKCFLHALLAEISHHNIAELETERWLKEIDSLRKKSSGKQGGSRDGSSGSMLHPDDVYSAINKHVMSSERSCVVTDVGQHQMWAAQKLHWERPGTHITSGGAGTMGFSIPAALGVAVANSDDEVWVICGDGGFQMTSQELATIQQEGITNMRIAIINNGYLGMVRQWQELFEGKVYSNTPLSSPDFVMLAESYGLTGCRVSHRDKLDKMFNTVRNAHNTVVIDFRVAAEANVFPIVPQGKSIGEMMLSSFPHQSFHQPPHHSSQRGN